MGAANWCGEGAFCALSVAVFGTLNADCTGTRRFKCDVIVVDQSYIKTTMVA